MHGETVKFERSEILWKFWNVVLDKEVEPIVWKKKNEKVLTTPRRIPYIPV